MKSHRSRCGTSHFFGAGLRFRCCDRQITSCFKSSAFGLGPNRCVMLFQALISGTLPPSPQPVIERRDELSLLRPLSKGTAASAASDTGAGGPVCASVSSSEPVGEPAPVCTGGPGCASVFAPAPVGALTPVCASAHFGASSGMRGWKIPPFGAQIFFGRQRVEISTARQRGNSTREGRHLEPYFSKKTKKIVLLERNRHGMLRQLATAVRPVCRW